MSFIESFEMFFYTYTKMANEYNYMEEYEDITFASYQYLNAIFNMETMTITKLSEVIGVKKSSVTQMIDGLCEKGYVAKVKNEADKRSSLIVLTDKGQQMMQSDDNAYKFFMKVISESLTTDELDQLEVLFDKLTEAVKNYDNK